MSNMIAFRVYPAFFIDTMHDKNQLHLQYRSRDLKILSKKYYKRLKDFKNITLPVVLFRFSIR